MFKQPFNLLTQPKGDAKLKTYSSPKQQVNMYGIIMCFIRWFVCHSQGENFKWVKGELHPKINHVLFMHLYTLNIFETFLACFITIIRYPLARKTLAKIEHVSKSSRLKYFLFWVERSDDVEAGTRITVFTEAWENVVS